MTRSMAVIESHLVSLKNSDIDTCRSVNKVTLEVTKQSFEADYQSLSINNHYRDTVDDYYRVFDDYVCLLVTKCREY
jgi:hypothetical protein